MFYRCSDEGFTEAQKGIRFKVVARGEASQMVEFHLAKGADIAAHRHDVEQTGTLISGRLRFTVGAETFEAAAGDCWSIAPGTPHAAVVLEEARVFEIFSPPRDDLPQPRKTH